MATSFSEGGPWPQAFGERSLKGSGHSCLANWQSACFSLQVGDRVKFSPKPLSPRLHTGCFYLVRFLFLPQILDLYPRAHSTCPHGWDLKVKANLASSYFNLRLPLSFHSQTGGSESSSPLLPDASLIQRRLSRPGKGRGGYESRRHREGHRGTTEAASGGSPATVISRGSRSWTRQEDPPLEPSEGAQLCRHPECRLWPPELCRYELL